MPKLKTNVHENIWVDKAIDLAIMFLGLYAAMGLQDLVDYSRDKSQYRQLIEGFQEEVKSNQRQRGALESSLGSLDEQAVFGEAEASFDYFIALSGYAERFSACYTTLRLSKTKKGKRGVSAKELAGCKRTLSTKFALKRPALLSLSPVYRRDVWQLYLADGVRLFRSFERKAEATRCTIEGQPSRELSICVGSIYNQLDDVESQVAQIQALVNETYFYNQGVLDAELKAFKRGVKGLKGKPDAEVISTLKALNESLANVIKERRLRVDISRSQLRAKIQQLKQTARTLDDRFKEVLKALVWELS